MLKAISNVRSDLVSSHLSAAFTKEKLNPQTRAGAIQLMAETKRQEKLASLAKELDNTGIKLMRERHIARGQREARWERRDIRIALQAKIHSLAQQIKDWGGQVDRVMGRPYVPPPSQGTPR